MSATPGDVTQVSIFCCVSGDLQDVKFQHRSSRLPVTWCLQLKETSSLSLEMILRRNGWIKAAVLVVLSILRIHSFPCHLTEYKTGNGCCPMCPPGSRVKSDCTEDRSTSCLPCVAGTFMDKPTGQKMCFPCSVCDSGSGLKTKHSCSLASDTVCEPLEGFFCIDSTPGRCSAAQRHSRCEPGDFISKAGTSSSDAECSPCSRGTFSNGSSASCQPHTQCETKNLQLTKEGTSSSDAECGERAAVAPVAAGVGVGLLLLLLALGAAGLYFRNQIKCTGKQSCAETLNRKEPELPLKECALMVQRSPGAGETEITPFE
ncbi:tumor necrosis factor receptor superfamily member 14 isoform X3 [Nothobranchius furzeri]|uniref:Transcript variant X3 n=1 Tax=Nothobranchius furzeri TaxID=105023 RepID=A0A9D3BJJ4_NOTFU|nr:transcript variant X3 [Nothobranchius furzeri]